jgi:hypothetical protein
MLTVNAVNSTMSSLLAAIRSRTGIAFEGAENSSERVAVSLGPAPEGEVLAAIFSGSGFDYVVLGRADSPETVQRVVLTPKNKGSVGAAGAAGAVAAGRPPVAQPPQSQQEGEEEVPEESANVEQEPQDTAAQPPQVSPPPAAENQAENPNPAPKTPEQLLQELKQMQQRQQDQQGDQPPTGAQPPNGNQVPRKMPPILR